MAIKTTKTPAKGKTTATPAPTATEPQASTDGRTEAVLGQFRNTIVALVRREGPDLSSRQLGVFLTTYLEDGPHTVRGMAADLNVSKPAITRAIDRLEQFDLAKRQPDVADRRSVLVGRTRKGLAFLKTLQGMAEGTAGKAKPGAARPKAA